MGSTGVDVFKLFSEHPGSPKSIDDLDDFEEACRLEGYEPLAVWIREWHVQLDYQIMREWDIGETANETSSSGEI